MMNRKLSGRQLTVARISWIIFALLLATLHIAGQIASFRQANATDLTPDQLQGLAAMGVSVPVYLFFNVLLLLFFPVLWGGLGLLIFWRKSNERGALIVSAMMVGAGMAATIPVWEAFAAAYPEWVWVVPLAALVGNLCIGSFFFVFPNGRFVPRWAIGVVPLLSAYNILNSYAFALPPFGVELGQKLAWLFPVFVTLSLLGFLAPLYRYRRASTKVEREQIKWVVFTIIVGITIFAATASTVFLLPNANPNEDISIITVFVQPIGWIVSLQLIPVAMAIAILRYRLFDIDVLIRKTLQYSLLTGLLALTYSGLVVLLQTVVDRIADEQSPLVIVLSTLLIAALFAPLRRRVQTFIDRRFYRHRYDAQQVLAQFAQTARDEVSLEALTAELTGVIQETMRPERVAIWLATGKRA